MRKGMLNESEKGVRGEVKMMHQSVFESLCPNFVRRESS